MEPVTTIAMLHLAGQLSEHVLGHVAHDQLHKIRHAIVERLHSTDLPLNHDLQEASSEAFRQATKSFYLGIAASVEPKQPLFPLILDHFRKGTLRSAPPLMGIRSSPKLEWLSNLWRLLENEHALRRLERISLPAGTSPARLVGESPSSDIAGWLHEHFLVWLDDELSPFPDDPVRVSELVTQGWFVDAERRVRINLFQAWCLFFREQVKRRAPVFNILVAQSLEETRAVLAQLDAKLGAVPERLDELLALRLDPLESWLTARFEELKAAAEKQAATARSTEDDKRRSLVEQHFVHVDAAFIAGQRREPLRQSLQAPLGDWAFACRGMAVPRDLETTLVPLAVANEDPAALMLIGGDPGSGKSVLMRRIALALIEAGRSVYELRRRSYRTQEWYSLVGALGDERRPAVLLVDDIFRCSGIEDYFKDHDARGFVIATTRSNEDQSRHLALNAFSTLKIDRSDGKRTWPRLTTPTDAELERIRNLPSFQQLTDAEWSHLSTTRVGGKVRKAPMLVLMIQMAGRDAFERIVSKTVLELRQEHPATYEALGVVSVFHRLGMSVPSSLLGRLIENVYFMEALSTDVDNEMGQTGARGLLFHDNLGAWHTGHELIAEAIAGTEYPHVEKTHDRLFAIATSGDAEASTFLANCFIECMRSDNTAVLRSLEGRLANLSLAALPPNAAAAWAGFFGSKGDAVSASRCLQIANPSIEDGLAYLQLVKKYGPVPKSAAVAASWASTPHSSRSLKCASLDFIRERGDDAQVDTVAATILRQFGDGYYDDEVARWFFSFVSCRGQRTAIDELAEMGNAWTRRLDCKASLVESFLGFVEEHGSVAQITEARASTENWLEDHPGDTLVRPQFLRDVLAFAPKDELRRWVEKCEGWLSTHADNDDRVRTQYVKLLRLAFNDIERAAVVDEVHAWLSANPGSMTVWAQYLLLAVSTADRTMVESALAKSETLLASRGPLAGLYCSILATHGSTKQVESALNRGKALLEEAPADYQLRTALWQLSLDTGRVTIDEIVRSLADLRDAGFKVVPHLRYRFAEILMGQGRDALAGEELRALCGERPTPAYLNLWGSALQRLGEPAAAETAFKRAIDMSTSAKRRTFSNNLGRLYLKEVRIPEAMVVFEQAIDRWPTYVWPRLGLADASVVLHN